MASDYSRSASEQSFFSADSHSQSSAPLPPAPTIPIDSSLASTAPHSTPTSRPSNSQFRSYDIVDLDSEAVVMLSPELGSQQEFATDHSRKRRRVESSSVIDIEDDSESDLQKYNVSPLLNGDEDSEDEDEEGQSGEHREWQRKQLEKPTESSSILSDFSCVICFDQPDILALTPCGHMYCMDCIWRALTTGAKATTAGGECPICRRKVQLKKVIPLQMRLADEETDEVDEVSPPVAESSGSQSK
ncbi:uncharacterized protein V2V93DRAFT_366001 [Kockiozyma suomiensis]|uniref:uncharacterized protein n=1 Tax=Kockiozyma suomiensis TaxID=1337062 RepID=UPI003343AEF3